MQHLVRLRVMGGQGDLIFCHRRALTDGPRIGDKKCSLVSQSVGQ